MCAASMLDSATAAASDARAACGHRGQRRAEADTAGHRVVQPVAGTDQYRCRWAAVMVM
jgi:hypothetical protein